MALSEFALIARYFAAQPARDDVILGVGDDCALLSVPPGMQLAVSIDTMVAGVHFPLETHPTDIGHKLMAVNLSDLAAMGAQPAWATLALTLPSSDADWLEAFCTGLYGLAAHYQVQIVGGDTTHGPLALSLQIHGFVPAGQALRRSGARVGDLILLTGPLGEAAIGLDCLIHGLSLPEPLRTQAITRLNRPAPRVAAGLALQGLANSAIDISDGLIADLGHILNASGVGAVVELDCLPRTEVLTAALAAGATLDRLLSGGDDYELCFTCAADQLAAVTDALAKAGVDCHPIGHIVPTPGLQLLQSDGTVYRAAQSGYDHFATGG